jgi:hypothetical protein
VPPKFYFDLPICKFALAISEALDYDINFELHVSDLKNFLHPSGLQRF